MVKEYQERRDARAKLSNAVRIIMSVIICATVVALVYNVRFSHSNSDDYTFSRLIEQLDGESFVAYRYRTWNGRFTSDIWYAVLYSIVGVRSYHWLGPLIIIVIFTMLPWYVYARFLCARNSTLRGPRRGLAPGVYLGATLLFLHFTPYPYRFCTIHHACRSSISNWIGASIVADGRPVRDRSRGASRYRKQVAPCACSRWPVRFGVVYQWIPRVVHLAILAILWRGTVVVTTT